MEIQTTIKNQTSRIDTHTLVIEPPAHPQKNPRGALGKPTSASVPKIFLLQALRSRAFGLAIPVPLYYSYTGITIFFV